MTPFSLEVARAYMAEAVQKRSRCKMNGEAWKSELRSLAPMILHLYRNRKVQDWKPARPAPAASEH